MQSIRSRIWHMVNIQTHHFVSLSREKSLADALSPSISAAHVYNDACLNLRSKHRTLSHAGNHRGRAVPPASSMWANYQWDICGQPALQRGAAPPKKIKRADDVTNRHTQMHTCLKTCWWRTAKSSLTAAVLHKETRLRLSANADKHVHTHCSAQLLNRAKYLTVETLIVLCLLCVLLLRK